MSHAIRTNQRPKLEDAVLVFVSVVTIATVVAATGYSYFRDTVRSQVGAMSAELAGGPVSLHSAEAKRSTSPEIGVGFNSLGGAGSPVSEGIGELEVVEEVKSDSDLVLESLKEANAAFNTPERIDLHRTERVHFLLSPDVPVDVLEAMIAASGGDPVETATIRFHQRMEAKLSGAGFEIRPITREIQGVASHGVAEWKWDVTAMQAGTHTLHLSVSVLFKADGVDTGASIKTFEKDIVVEVRALDLAKDFILKEWQWLWSTVLVPFAGWLWLAWRRRRARQKEQGLSSARFYAVG